MSNKTKRPRPMLPPRPPAPGPRRLNFAEFREQRLAEGHVLIELGDDHDPIMIPPPELWPDNLGRSAEGIWSNIIGADELERFREVTGLGVRALDAAFTEAQGMTAPESSASAG
jgi:hypothetical protein